MVNINHDTNTSPMATWAMNAVEKQSNAGQWAKSRLTVAASSVPVLGDAALVNLPLGLAKTAVAVTFKTAELALACFGKNVNLNDYCLSNYTGTQAATHLGKTVAGVIGSVVCLLGFTAPSVAIAFNRALGLAKTPAAPLTKTQKVMNAVVNSGKKVGRGVKKGAQMTVAQARKHPYIAIAAGVAIAGAAEYKFGYGQQVAGMALNQGAFVAGKVDDLTGNYVSGGYNAVAGKVAGGYSVVADKVAGTYNYFKSFIVSPDECVDNRSWYNFWSANPCVAK